MSTVRDIYQREFPRLQQDDTIVQAVQQLREFNLTGSPVFNKDNELVGYLSEQDCLTAMLHASYFCSLHNTIAQVMSKKVVTVLASDSLVDSAVIFTSLHLHQLPVLENGSVVGVLNRGQVVRALEATLGDCYGGERAA
ncbi:CBS domain-containing protein [Rheinheimera tangshanensis]|jgi:CBS-domain-containing membrane protein|uniref:CBS domain-containing protein n=1 Tax=Rheinheimera tangshanensis TaxID=400153 RepID=A0A5C8M383_9GAMM|nr:CBS domain-containing protein [Rheinheimera tangshanensis]TXK82925.1 CBS domain-containing protein [Rheinheimera tangshanensis]GGM47794.1 CBS domain-containing protein [Rheinheimera tangshanensis]